MKVRYRTELEARAALESTVAAAERSERRHECRTYRCPVCRGHHLTSQAKG